jgi:uncharacterized protein YpmB
MTRTTYHYIPQMYRNGPFMYPSEGTTQLLLNPHFRNKMQQFIYEMIFIIIVLNVTNGTFIYSSGQPFKKWIIEHSYLIRIKQWTYMTRTTYHYIPQMYRNGPFMYPWQKISCFAGRFYAQLLLNPHFRNKMQQFIYEMIFIIIVLNVTNGTFIYSSGQPFKKCAPFSQSFWRDKTSSVKVFCQCLNKTKNKSYTSSLQPNKFLIGKNALF